jgi:hypothetical protein
MSTRSFQIKTGNTNCCKNTEPILELKSVNEKNETEADTSYLLLKNFTKSFLAKTVIFASGYSAAKAFNILIANISIPCTDPEDKRSTPICIKL